MSTKTYQAVKNYIHNELGVDFRKLIEDEVRRYVETYMNDQTYIQALIKDEVWKRISYDVKGEVAEKLAKRIILEVENPPNNPLHGSAQATQPPQD